MIVMILTMTAAQLFVITTNFVLLLIMFVGTISTVVLLVLLLATRTVLAFILLKLITFSLRQWSLSL
jgi:hypothetical protein